MLQLSIGRLGALLASSMLLLGNALAAEPCGDWHPAGSPNPSVVNRALHIAGRSPNDLWLLGSAGPTYPGTPMIWHGEGGGWTTIPLPDTSSLGSLPSFNAITQLPNGDVLVGGDVRTSYPIDNRPFVARWNGSEWAEVTGLMLRPQTVYPFGPRGGLIADLFAAGPDDIWALGYAANMGSGGGVPMAVHFDGSTWTEVETPIESTRTNQLIAVDGSGSSDIWAVGVQRNVGGGYFPFSMHWDGGSWTYQAPPAGATGSFDAVAVISPTDAWALGASMFAHWDGVAWQPAPKPSGASSAAIEALASDDIWVAHMTGGYFHWNGSAWSFVPSPVTPLPGQFTQIRDFAQVGACDVWAAGSVLALDGSAPSTTIVERLIPSTMIGDVDGDGDVDGADLTIFVAVLLGGDTDPAHVAACDLNHDGAANGNDTQTLVSILTGAP